MTPDMFIRKICHDLRAPIRGLREIPEWLNEDLTDQMGTVPDSVKELLDMLTTQAVRLDGIVIGLSDLAKITRHEGQAWCTVDTCLDAVDLPDKVKKHVVVQDLPIEEPHGRLVFQHLLSNAVHHGEAAEKGCDLVVMRRGDLTTIAVRDFGPGIAVEHRDDIYEPLYTLKPRDDCETSGMGLAVVKRIVDLYGGRCAIHDNPAGVGIISEASFPTPPSQ